MKKVKIALSAIAVFAVIGGALAFKARTTDFIYTHASTDTKTDRCTSKVFNFTAVDNGETPVLRVASSLPVQADCTIQIPVYPAE